MSYKSSFDSDVNQCKWIAAKKMCAYSPPNFENKTIGFICMITTLLTIPFTIIIDYFAEILGSPLVHTAGNHSLKSEYFRLKHKFSSKAFTTVIPEENDKWIEISNQGKLFIEFMNHIKFIGNLLSKSDRVLFYRMWRFQKYCIEFYVY